MTLVRRGYRTVEAARAFLEADDDHDPFLFEAMAEVCDRLRVAIATGRRITVHGDYDVDGVCSTAILVRTMRELGGDCDWLIPGRLEDGYGLTRATVERLAARGTALLLTTDCGIGSVAEVEAALAAGIEVIVTDHHQPGEKLPDCPILHPALSGYPFAELCATGVAYKLAAALRGERAAEAELDLVALATVADLVPLRGENRALVRRGLAVARRARRPGMRALIATASVAPERLDEGDFAFRLGPRINAAGRLYRADAGVELMLTDDADRAQAIAAELERANHERRQVEREVLAAAERARARAAARARRGAGLVLAGEGWHPGVVGIVASRMVERHRRPAVLIALDADGGGRGSGRSIPGFDLLGALQACDAHLTRYGGHRAAAGLEIEAGEIEAFRAAFAEHCAAALDGVPDPGRRDRRRGRRRREPRPRGRRAAAPPGAVRQRQPRGPAAGPRRQARRRAADGRGRPPRPLRDHQRRPAGARRRLRRRRLARRRRRGAGRSTSRSSSSSTSGTARSSRGSCSARPTRSTRRRPAGEAAIGEDEFWRRYELELERGLEPWPPALARRPARARPVDRRGASAWRRSPRWPPAARRCWRCAPTRSAAASWSRAPRARPGSAAASWRSSRRGSPTRRSRRPRRG